VETKVFDGKLAAAIIKRDLKFEAEKLGLCPNLAVILVGNDHASLTYVGRKQKACEELGFGFQLIKLPARSNFDTISHKIQVLNEDPQIHGILVQLPLPKFISAGQIISLIKKGKEIDGLSPTSPYTSPTAQAVIHVLMEEKVDLKEAEAVVLGRGKTAGAPIAKALKMRGAKVFVANSQTPASLLTSHLLTSDLVVSAVGKPNLITGPMIKEGATVISVGMSRLELDSPSNTRLVGDIDETSLMGRTELITPTPGGIGPLTVAFLLKNLLRACELQKCRHP
jgi:methylenetetrahydrofolate dehydrogenase (NADP+)/methenyltetrahydrofolate cyclohydrolase